ncbi:hypothetical protein QFC19_008539 [Naganishia cerealis]|uniref:Uncharacterized protein n=1 Tax=Naganishia cerealis TaxID=610337 RepID=A0ACC2V268_9TREE|nr:hypothetical protein QFC19_008539 [Naganishia cerealis]
MSSANFLSLLAAELQNDTPHPAISTPTLTSQPQMNKLKRYFGRDRLPLPRLNTRIRLQNDLVVVHPRSTPLPMDPVDESTSGTELGVPDDTLLFGHATITAEPYINIYSVRVGLVVVYRYKLSADDKPCESIIFEQYKSFSQDEIQLTVKESSRLIHRRVNFDILVPASLPTYEHSVHGIILPQVRVMVEFGYNSLSRETIDLIAANPPLAMDEKEEPSLILGRTMITDRWQGGGTVYVPKRSYTINTTCNDSDSSIETVLERRVQTWVKNMAVIANSNPTAGIHSLRVHKTGVAPGIGEWHVYLLSDSFSVGGYVVPRLELTSLAPGSTIYAIHLQLHQIFHITPPEEYRFNPNGQEQFNPSEKRCPPEKIPIFQDGMIPGERKPRKGTQALWHGPKKAEIKDSVGAFVWQQEKLRIPDESKTRPSTVVGTSTLMRVQHELSLRIFFSIEGETIGGQAIQVLLYQRKSLAAGIFNFKHLTGALNSSLNSVDVSGLTKNFKSTVQSTRERLGQVDPSEVTELPAEYKALENRVDALYNVHKGLLKIVKVHETESYDYPTQITESFGELTHQVSTGWTNFAHHNLKNANLPFPIAPAQPASSRPTPPKTLPHAMSRAAREGALNVGDARLQQDEIIVDNFITPWQATLSSSLALANKARANVKAARLELDTARAALKTAGPKTQEQARLQVEEAEDKLVQMTETAIGLMKAVLENPEPLQNLSSLVKAQLIYFSTAAETLSGIQGEIEEAAVAAETEYRQSRAA